MDQGWILQEPIAFDQRYPKHSIHEIQMRLWR
jgi:hypothetical protein